MTSRDLERSNPWPQYAQTQSAISRKRLAIETSFQRTTDRKWHMGYQMVTWRITSRDPKGAVRGSMVGYPSNSLASCLFVSSSSLRIVILAWVQRQQTRLHRTYSSRTRRIRQDSQTDDHSAK